MLYLVAFIITTNTTYPPPSVQHTEVESSLWLRMVNADRLEFRGGWVG